LASGQDRIAALLSLLGEAPCNGTAIYTIRTADHQGIRDEPVD
jgi:hypothetical protein